MAVDEKAVRSIVVDESDSEVYRPIETTYLLAEVVCNVALPGDEILEIGTGTGLVAIAAAKFVDNSSVAASDINRNAIRIARENARASGVDIRLIESDMFTRIPQQRFDIIAAHPPAVPYPPRGTRDPPGKTWGFSQGMEEATDGGPDGSVLVRRTIVESRSYLRDGGALVLGLPHWSNAALAFKTLEKSGYRYVVARKVSVEFFPISRGAPSEQSRNYIEELADNGVVEIDLRKDPPLSPVSIIVAWPRRKDGSL